MIKKILLPLDPSPYTDCAADFAITIAKLYNAEITGLVVLDIEGIEAQTGPLPPGVGFYAKELEAAKIDTAKVHIKNLLSKYKSRVEAAGVKFKDAKAQGSPSEKIAEIAKFYDIAILGLRNNYHFETSEDIENSLDEVLESCVTPIFAVPETPAKFATNKDVFKVIISYNETEGSLRAFQRFAQLELPKEVEVTVFISHEDKVQAEGLFEQAKDYLVAHGVSKVTPVITDMDKIEYFAGKNLDDTDIIVVGAHSKGGIFDFLFGSLSRHLINENKNLIFTCQ